MCYSALIQSNLGRLAQEFGARTDLESFYALYRLRVEHPELKIPLGIDRYFAFSNEPTEKKLAS